MYTLLILFFTSLFCIVVMIWRRLALVRSGSIVVEENLPHPFIPELHKIKRLSFKGLKKLLDIIIIIALRLYVKLVNFLKNQYGKIKMKIRSMSQENRDGSGLLNREANKVLKVVSEYKNKIHRMKKNIVEEEKKL
jgi:hypothetical protein